MNFQLDYIKQKMAEIGITDYDIEPILVSVPAADDQLVKFSDNKYFLLVNAFSDGALTGKITSDINAMEITSVNMNTEYYKYQLFKNNLLIKNRHASEIMYVEFLRITPALCV